MKNSRVERRADMFKNSLGERFNAAVVMQGMLLQREVNTVTAIEYMQNRGISGAIIQRVLAGADRRDTDGASLAQRGALAGDRIGAGA